MLEASDPRLIGVGRVYEIAVVHGDQVDVVDREVGVVSDQRPETVVGAGDDRLAAG